MTKAEIVEILEQELKTARQIKDEIEADDEKRKAYESVCPGFIEFQKKHIANLQKLIEDIKNEKSVGRIMAAKVTQGKRIKKTTEKIRNGMDLLILQGEEKITPAKLAKAAEVTFVTAKKYLTSIAKDHSPYYPDSIVARIVLVERNKQENESFPKDRDQ